MMRAQLRNGSLAVLLVCAACFGGCATDGTAEQPTVPAAQTAAAASPAAHPRLFYIGLALYPEQWSRNDVVDLADTLRSNSPLEVVPLIASNYPDGAQPAYPVADDPTMAGLIRSAAERAGPDDVVFVHISTHGGPGVLARQTDDGRQDVIGEFRLWQLLEPLGRHRTIIALSACYSGSLIGSLQSPNRIIITAARADRSSFGCAAVSRHTFFGDAELAGFGVRGRSLHQAFTVITHEVASMEQAQEYGPPSQPQISVGAGVRELYDSPLF
jgi:hypothetical protein